MSPESDRQRRAACADLERMDAGEELMTFRGISRAELEKMCHGEMEPGRPSKGKAMANKVRSYLRTAFTRNPS